MNRQINRPIIGMLGGGQLGRMFIQNALSYDALIHVLDPDKDAPCAAIASHFMCGSFKDYDTVLTFGRSADIITVEIEDVNIEALIQLQKEGKKVFPQPDVLSVIKDKGLQKEFYKRHQIPTSDFVLLQRGTDVRDLDASWFPSFLKMRTSGYDGKGVQKIKSKDEATFDVPCILEKCIDVKQEFAVLVSRHKDGTLATFPVVDMDFHPEANLVEFLNAPSSLSEEQQQMALDLAKKIATQLGIVGVLAVEFFLDTNNIIWVNEMAPRPHNSGHHTIEANAVSQFDQHFRCIMGFAPGDTRALQASVMLNLLGEEGYVGPVLYEGLNEATDLPGVHLHFYGKRQTKPFRKMGHVTITADTAQEAKKIAHKVRSIIKVKSHNHE
jgi:5-(carboxyamino)imidazole ribonucleotide synthase